MMAFNFKSRLGFPIAISMVILAVTFAAGCTIRTQTGTEYKILDQAGRPPEDDAASTGETQDTYKPADPAEPDPFAELSRSEQEDLAVREVTPKKPAALDPKPKEEKTTEADPSPTDAFPTRITNKPKATLPLQTQLHPVPAGSEVLLFDPEVKRRSNRQAALDLTNEGRNALATGKVELAIAKFQKAISVDSKCGHAYFYFARARFVQQDWDQVVALTDKSALHLTEDPVFLSRAHLLKAQALANEKRYVPALAACESAIDADETNVQAKLLRNRLKALY